MPKKGRETESTDHLSSALESLRERPRSRVGLESDERIATFSYVAGIGAESADTAERALPGKQRMGFNLPGDLCERVRNAVWHLADRIGVNLSSLTERVLAAEIARLEKEFNDGKPFPKRKGKLKRGRAARGRSSRTP